jgi:hypothetical protein
MKLSASLLTVSCLWFCTQARSQSLVYSLTYMETGASFRAHFANVSPFPGRRSDDENLSMLRGTRKTEIYSLSLATGKSALLFSDEGPHLQIMATGAVTNDGKAYIAGFWRERRTTPTPTVTSDEAIYEISLDGSNHFRKIADAQPNQPPAVLNPQSTRAAFESFKDGKFVVSIYAVPEWKLLHTWDLAKLMQTHCPACNPLSYGWLADGKRLYIELAFAGEEDEDSSPTSHPGTYFLSEDGADLGGVSPQTGALHLDGYIHPKYIERHFLGQLPDGSDLFLDHAVKKGGPFSELHPYLIVANSDPKAQKQFPLKFAIGPVVSSLSGKYLAYIEDRQTPNYRTELHLWVKDLESGAERELFAAPPPNPPASPEPNLILSILGWINN